MMLIAHDIRSLYNVGSIFRNAAAFGVEKIYLTGITGQPPRKEIAKVALGAEKMVPWETGNDLEIIQALKSEGKKIVALENHEDAIEIQDLDCPWQDIVLVLGNEVEGVAPHLLALCDQAIIIPMEQKRSLNVSVATGVALYAIKNK